MTKGLPSCEAMRAVSLQVMTMKARERPGDAIGQLPGCHNADARFRAETQYRSPGSFSETLAQRKTKCTAGQIRELAGNKTYGWLLGR